MDWQFEWDPAKCMANLSRHGVDFEDVKRVFGPDLLTRKDDRREYEEVRFIGLGPMDGRLMLSFSHLGVRVVSASFRQGRQTVVNRKSTSKRSRTGLKKPDAMKDADIDYSDIPELPDDFAESAEWFMPAPKALLSLRMDADVVEWFKSQGAGYQSRMNAVLKAYMLRTGNRNEVRDVRAKYLPAAARKTRK